MNIGFFEICSRELTRDGDFQYRRRMRPWAPQLDALYSYAERQGFPFVFTTCCGGNMLSPNSRKDVLFIPINGANTQWQSRINDHRLFYAEKVADCTLQSGSKFENHALFHYNQNILKLVELLSVDEWVVYGNSLDCCVDDTVTGLINAGKKVIFLSDLLCKSSAGTDECTVRTLAVWRTLGAAERTSGELLAGRCNSVGN